MTSNVVTRIYSNVKYLKKYSFYRNHGSRTSLSPCGISIAPCSETRENVRNHGHCRKKEWEWSFKKKRTTENNNTQILHLCCSENVACDISRKGFTHDQVSFSCDHRNHMNCDLNIEKIFELIYEIASLGHYWLNSLNLSRNVAKKYRV